MKFSPGIIAICFIALCGIVAMVINLQFDERSRRVGKVEKRAVIDEKPLRITQNPDGLSTNLGGPTGAASSVNVTLAPATRPALFNNDRDVLQFRAPESAASSRPQ